MKLVSGFKSVLVKLSAWRTGSAGHTLFVAKLIGLECLLGLCVSPLQKPHVGGLLIPCKTTCMEICVRVKL